jgi:hypothetical protein
VKTVSRLDGLGDLLDCQLVTGTRGPITDGLTLFPGPQIGPNPDIAKWPQHSVVEARCPFDVEGTQRNVMNHEIASEGVIAVDSQMDSPIS